MTRAAWSPPKSDAGAQGTADRQLTLGSHSVGAFEPAVKLPRRDDWLCAGHTLERSAPCHLAYSLNSCAGGVSAIRNPRARH